MRRTLSITLAAAALAAAVVPAASASTEATSLNSVAWGPCPADVTAPDLQCSTVKVPVDYRKPDGPKFDLAISRLPSTNPAHRRGVLLTNPGGPGGEGLDYPHILNIIKLPASVRDAYDVIGFDPRGVGHSAPVTCDLTAEQKAFGNFPRYAHNQADVTKAAEEAKTLATQCATSKTASMLPYITTANSARDMDRIRVALGEQKVSYLGYSYGTYLGAVYTTMFPERSDRIVLDSNMGPGGYDFTAMRNFALGLQDRFPDFAKFAAANPQYGLGRTTEQITAKFYELAARLKKAPVHGIDDNAFRGLTFGNLYGSDYAYLAGAWHDLDTNQPVSPQPVPPNLDNLSSSRLYTICGDSRWPRTIPAYQAAIAVDRVRYPMLGASTANVSPCAYWPSDPVEPPVRIGDRGPSNVLMVQNLRDPGTPLAGALKTRQALGNRARMVTVDQGGHGVYLITRNQCANDTVTAFLANGQRPAHDLACAG
ncbi:MAG TPA: alpha/beta hydrolase [Amycolatopsis sp.]